MTTNAEEIIVVTAIRRSFETHGTAGSSVNIGPNPFTPGLIGTFDLLKAAQAVLHDLAQHRERIAKRDADAATAASAVDGH